MEFLENRRSWRKAKTPRKSPEKWTFLSLAFYNAPSLHTVKVTFGVASGVALGKTPKVIFESLLSYFYFIGTSGLLGGQQRFAVRPPRHAPYSEFQGLSCQKIAKVLVFL